jgi:tetratricopeptide (TPR) repeat protein
VLVSDASHNCRPMQVRVGRRGSASGALAGVLVSLMVAPGMAAEIEDAWRLFNAGKYAECVTVADEEIASGNYVEAWRRLKVEGELAQGDYDAALATVDEALSLYPGSIPLRLLAATVYQVNGQAARAATELDLIEQLAVNDPREYSSRESRVALGRFFLRRGADARQVLEIFFDPVVKAAPDYVEAHLATAELSLDKYDNALAAEVLQKAPDGAKESPRYYYLLARAYQQDDPQAAAAAIAAALKINPRHVPTLLLQVDGLIDSEQYDAASEVLDEIQEVNPREPLAWAYRAVLLHLENEPEREQASRQRALATWTDNPAVDHTIGRKLSDKYRFAEGAAHQRRSLAMDPTYQPARMQLAQDLLRLGEDDEGWRLASEVFDADGYNVVAHNLVQLQDSVKDYRVLMTKSFRVRMEAREAAIYGARALALLERAKETLCEKYDVELDGAIAVEIFAQQKDFAVRTFGLPGADGFLGVCFGNVITANSPAALGDVSANWESVLWHEFCHVVTLRKSHNKMPRWLSEGISVYEERQENPTWGQTMTPESRQIIVGGEMPPVSQLSGSFLAPESPAALQFAYYQSSLVVEFLIERYGIDAIKQVLADLGAGMAIEESLVRNAAPLNRLDVDFEKFARMRAEQMAPELTWDKFDLEPNADSDAVEAWLAEHPENFQGLVRLAQTLQREEKWRESLKPAKMLARLFPDNVGSGNAYVLLARAYRELDNSEGEREALEELASRSADALDAYDRLAEMAEADDDWAAVATNVQRTLAVDPLTATPHRRLARAAEELKRPAEAIDAYRALLEFDATDPADVHYRLATLMRERGDTVAARRHVLMAVEEAPRFLAAHRLLLELVGEDSVGSDVHR